MDNRPMAMFDSGFGGLTALKEFRRICPEEQVIYFGDSGRMPYGAKTVDQLHTIVRQNLDFLKGLGAKRIVIACGTASVNSDEIIAGYDIPTIGAVRPTVEVLAEAKGEGPLCIIATEASIRSGAYERGLRAAGVSRELISIPCPDFVTLIESGHTSADDPLVIEAVERYLSPAKEKGVQTILLGCTHYGIIGEAIARFLGENVEQISAAECVARKMAELLDEDSRASGDGGVCYYTSGSAKEFSRLAAMIMGEEVNGVREIPVMEY